MVERELFRQRSYQRVARLERAKGCKRFLRLWHRRAGKDRDTVAFLFEEMLKRKGVYFYIFPSLNQGRRDLWANIVQETRDGIERSVKMLDIIPPELIKRKDESEMTLELIEPFGSVLQVMGADSEESVSRLRGPNPIGIVFSEYAHGSKMKQAWETLSPVLAENNGWAMFAYTPNGFNHGHELYESVKDDPAWFVQKLTIDDTRRDAVGEDGSPVISQTEIDQFRKEGQREEFLAQEYHCSFTGVLHGTIYGDLILRAQADGRIGRFPYLPTYPVGVCFDLGHTDAMSMWFYQRPHHQNVVFIDYWEDTQKDMKDAVRVLREGKPYTYGRVLLPWDGRAAADFMEAVHFRNIQVCDRPKSVQADIEVVRRNFSRYYFDSERCAKGLLCLQNYSREYDDDLGTFKMQPKHDKWSHGADALRTGEIGGWDPMLFMPGMQYEVKVESSFDPRMPYGR